MITMSKETRFMFPVISRLPKGTSFDLTRTITVKEKDYISVCVDSFKEADNIASKYPGTFFNRKWSPEQGWFEMYGEFHGIGIKIWGIPECEGGCNEAA